MYDDFASVYDTLMDDFDYDAWSAHYLTLIRTVTGELPRRVAECACGTGSLTVRHAACAFSLANFRGAWICLCASAWCDCKAEYR